MYQIDPNWSTNWHSWVLCTNESNLEEFAAVLYVLWKLDFIGIIIKSFAIFKLLMILLLSDLFSWLMVWTQLQMIKTSQCTEYTLKIQSLS